MTAHPGAGIVISGDRNSLDIQTLLNIEPSLRQWVKKCTLGLKVLDVILSNLGKFYDEPVIVQPILPDNPNKGVPSDHSGVVATPHTDPSKPHLKSKVVKTIRPLPESLISSFGQKLENEDWSCLEECETTTQMVEKLQIMLEALMTSTFPEKTITIYPDDKPWFTEKLRKLKRERQRLYRKGGKNEKYLECKEKFYELVKSEISKYKDKLITEVKEGKRGSAYKGLRKIGQKPGEFHEAGFTLPIYAEQKLSNLECAEMIASYFSAVSQEYSPLNVKSLPPNIQEFLEDPGLNLTPELSHYDV